MWIEQVTNHGFGTEQTENISTVSYLKIIQAQEGTAADAKGRKHTK